MKTYYNTKSQKFEKQLTKTSSSAKIEITETALLDGKQEEFEDDYGRKGFTSIINGIHFVVIDASTVRLSPEWDYDVYAIDYYPGAECVGIDKE